jgi:hypothetical protein
MITLVIATAPDHDCIDFIARIKQTSCTFEAIAFEDWLAIPHKLHPTGFVYLKVMPALVMKRIKQPFFDNEIEKQCALYDAYFVDKTAFSANLHNIPILILNGNIHVDDDFSQFYTHLFSIKKFAECLENDQRTEQGLPIKKKKKCGC